MHRKFLASCLASVLTVSTLLAVTMPAGAAENRQATTQAASTVSTKALTVQVPSGASITINGRDVGLNPADGYDPNPSDNDISTMKVIGTGAGTTELKNLPAGWYVSTQTWNWQGRNGIRYHVWSGSTNYNWFLSGATNFKHCVYELRSLDYFRFGDESNLLTGYDWSQNQTLHGYIENAQPGYHIVAGWSGGGQPLSDRYRYQWTADDDPSLTITHDFMYDSGEAPADWSKLMAWLPDGSPVTGFNPNGSSNKIPTGTKSVTWTGIPDGWNVSDTRVRTDRIVTDFSKTGQADRTVILFYSDDYEPTYTADQLKKLIATTDTGDPITGFDPVDGGTFALPATATGVTIDGLPEGWTLEGPDYDGTSITYQVSSPDSKIIRRYTFALPDHTPTLDDLADLTPTTDGGKTIDGFDPTKSGTYQVPEDATVSWTGIPRNGWTWSHVKGTLAWTIASVDGQYSFTYTFLPTHDPVADDLVGVTATTDTGEAVEGFDPVNGGTFPVPAGTKQVSLGNIPDGWTATPLDGGIGYTLTASNGLTVTYTFDVQPYTQMTADELAALAKYQWKSDDSTVQATANDTDTLEGHPTDWTLVWSGTGTNPLTEDPDAGWYDSKGNKVEASSLDAYEYRMKVTGPTSGVTATFTLHTSLRNEPIIHNVSFDMKGGSPQERTKRVIDGKTVAQPADPTREGYRFAGWLLNGKPYDFSTPVTANIVLTASWTAIGEHAIIFDSAGGSFIPAQTVEDGETGTQPEPPTREGYTFKGWLLDGQPYDFTQPVTGDITLTADWEQSMLSVTFDLGDGEPVTSVSVAYGDTVDEPEAPTRDGYEFADWLLNGTPYDFTQPVTKDLTLVADWMKAEHTVTFDTDGGSPIDSQSITDGDTVDEPKAPTKDGYVFSGWLEDGKPYDFSTPVTSDITLTAQWEKAAPAVHVVSFDTGKGSPVPSQNVTDGDKATEPDMPTLEGYEFTGWLLDGQPYDFSTPVTDDITLTAEWVKTPVNHTVTFDTDGGAELPSQTVADGETATQPEVPVRDGYVFLGWLLNGKAYDFSTPVTGDITLTASWEKEKPATHTIRFDTADGTTIPAQTVTDGSMATKPADPTRKGYMFNGWTVSGQPYDFSTPVTADLTIIAKWVPLPVEHTVLFDAGDGSKPTPTTVEDGKPVDKPKDPTRKGYTFDGWLLNGKAYDFTQPVTGDITLTGSWTRLTHTVTFDTNGGTPVASQSVEDGGVITSPKDPTREGYTFKGWLLNGKSYDFQTPVTGDITLTANWAKAKPASHTVTFDAANGSKPDTVKVEDGKTVTKPKDPTREGYTFQGWTSGGKTYDFDAPVTADITLTAQWEKNKPVTHTVTIDPANGTTADKLQVENGQTVRKPADPVRKGHTFQGWYQGDKPYDFSTPVTGDITITAHWSEDKPTPVTHTVTINPDNGEKTTTIKVEDGKTVTKPADPVLEGFTFTGWYKGNNPYEFSTPVTGDFTLTAHWQQSTPPMTIRTVTIDPANGEKTTVLKVEDGQKLTKPTDPKKNGYTFLAWYLNDKPYDFNQPVTGDITIVAQWEKNKPKTHTVTYDYAYDGLKGTAVVTDGKPLPKPTDPKRAGHVFKGWRLDGRTYDFNQPVTKDLTLTADWELSVPDRHTVTFDTKGGSAVSPITVKDGNTIAKPMTPTRKGYEFKGWLLNGKPYDFTTPVTSDITLIADWEKAGTTKPSYGIDDLKDLGFLVDGKPYKPFDPNTHEYRLGDGEHTVKIGKGTISADWRIMSDTVRQPDGTNKIGYSLTSPDGSFTVSYTFAWNEKAPEYTADDLKHVSATINGKPVNGFNPTHDGSYTVPDGSTVKIEGLPSEWRMTEDHDPAQPSMWLRYTITSPDSNVKVSYTFTSDKKGETTKPETGDTNQTEPGKGVDGTIANTVDSQLSSTGIGITRPLILAVPLLLAGIVIAGWPSLRRKRIR